ncbi:hypothetical protein [Hyphomicrobium sp.]|uniref:hypothetical protein n=1 Tax=Hyphomicrobium sp. TaxID=82 RepID=UPI000F9B67CD|nr:hypothetical protein [Hyphomicrobium sp.]RUO97360.1 MAG: hypothetical protein EKK30_16725 [Hyphomicrobium sp.]
MKTLISTAAAIALFAAPAFAADTNTNPNSTGGKPSASSNPSTDSAAKNEKAYNSTGNSGSSTGASGASDQQMPGASDSTKPDSSLSTNGNKMKQ